MGRPTPTVLNSLRRVANSLGEQRMVSARLVCMSLLAKPTPSRLTCLFIRVARDRKSRLPGVTPLHRWIAPIGPPSSIPEARMLVRVVVLLDNRTVPGLEPLLLLSFPWIGTKLTV